MLQFIQISGPFGIAAISIGSIGLVLALAEVATRGKKEFRRGVLIAAGVALLIGIAGTAHGFHIMAEAVSHAPETFTEAEIMQLWRAGFGVTMTTTVIGAMSAVANLLALGGLFGLASRRDYAV